MANAGDFKPKVLDSRTLATSIDANLAKNARLDASRDRSLIAQTYDKFRHEIGPMLLQNDWDDMSVITSFALIGDMMKLVQKFKSVPNRQKKEIILEVLDLVIENETPPEQHEKLRKVVANTISPAIDLAAYYIRRIKPKCQKLALGCC